MKYDITIGIPTCKRPNLLKRAIDSIISENSSIFLINISVDGVDETYEEYKKIENSLINYKNINFTFQEKNIGSLNNFLYLRDICKTQYFMWLADDDETNPNMILKLLDLLKNNKNAITAVPYWELVNKNNNRKLIQSSHFEDKNIFVRVLKYAYNSDDVFFYGLHRKKNIIECSFKGFWWPNHKAQSNWCYVFQMDLILQGRIVLLRDKECKWINHDYGSKYYDRTTTNIFVKEIAHFIRRINIYYLYFLKFIKWRKFSFLIFFILPFIFFFLRDIFLKEPIYKKIKF